MQWVLETTVFGETYGSRMKDAVRSCGNDFLVWSDEWWTTGMPSFAASAVFHGSLVNAARISSGEPAGTLRTFCETERFHCSSWYPSAEEWLLHKRYALSSVSVLVEDPRRVFSRVGSGDVAFVRPDSPLKPFSGRVLRVDDVSLVALDHGFYFDDDSLPVVVAPVVDVGREWRFVVVNRLVVAGSAYLPDGREGGGGLKATHPAWVFAASVAHRVSEPECVYVLDVCESSGELRLLEFNPFSGADLYDCDLQAVVEAVADVLK